MSASVRATRRTRSWPRIVRPHARVRRGAPPGPPARAWPPGAAEHGSCGRCTRPDSRAGAAPAPHGRQYPLPDRPRPLGLRLGHHVLGTRLLDPQDHVDPVEQRPAEPCPIAGGHRWVAAALTPRVALVSARTRIGCGDEQETCRKADRALRPRDPHAAFLEWLAQRLERGPRKLGSSSRNSTPCCARLASPGAGGPPPPTSPAAEIEWCGARNGLRCTSGAGPSTPATLWIRVTSSASPRLSGGMIEGRRLAAIDLPLPGGPIMSTL